METTPNNFRDYCESKGIKLRWWQLRIAQDFLEKMMPQRRIPSGKTTLLGLLSEFVCDHGNDYELFGEKTKQMMMALEGLSNGQVDYISKNGFSSPIRFSEGDK